MAISIPEHIPKKGRARKKKEKKRRHFTIFPKVLSGFRRGKRRKTRINSQVPIISGESGRGK